MLTLMCVGTSLFYLELPIMHFGYFILHLFSIANKNIIIDFLTYKHLNNIVILHCNRPSDIIYIQKLFYKKNIQVKTLEIRSNNTSYQISSNKSKVGIVLDTSCDGWSQIFTSFVTENIFKTFIWTIMTDNLSATAHVLNQQPIDIDSDVIIACRNGEIYRLYEVYNTGYYSNGTYKLNEVGFWDNEIIINKSFRRDLSGVILKCPVVITEKVENETYVDYLVKSRKPHIDSLHKLKFFTMLLYLQDMYSYSYDFKRVLSWGYNRNGSFDGLVGALQRQEADLSGSSLFFRSDRAAFIDYIIETWTSRQCFIFRHPKHPGAFYTIYTRPLTPEVWYCILGMLVVSATILGLMFKLKTQRTNDAESSFSLAILFSWSAICQQGMGIQSRTMMVSMKITILVIFVYALTLYQYYNAIVVSTLLHESPKNIRTLEDLLKSNIKAGVEDVLYTKDYFTRTTDPIALEMYSKKIATKNHYNFFEPSYGMALVKQGGFALHVDSVVAYRIMRETFTERENCELQEIEMYPPQKMGVAVKKWSPYKEQITYGIRKMFESGILRRLKSVWDVPKPPCVSTPDSSVFSVSLREVSIAFICLIVGVILSVFVLMCEILVHRVNGKRVEFRN
ncbi:ionotropic receptor 75a-like [Achroia grisella]|uniref:ionotropic receptor 75a-like n=1 Tax=Achroia grisella TaxID=688607 RepID=UPI0027D3260F|nr:ionotropic receptor 75a-like [Achroia grisella]